MSFAENTTALKRRRAIIQGSCTRVKTFVDSIAATTVTPSLAAQLEERRAKLNNYWSDYDSVQTSIEEQDENESNHRQIFEDAFYSISAKIRELLSVADLSRSAASPPPSNANAPVLPQALSHVRLPKLNLPTFSGKYDEWFPFFDSFQSMVQNNAYIDNIQRFQYLKASLTGDALNVISSLEISAVNYKVAWNLLKERYDNKRIIVQNHIKAIMELPSMTRENVVELRQIADGAQRHVHALQALKRPTSHWDDLFVHILGNKLDTLSAREWQNSLTSNELPTFGQFLEFVKHRCQMLESTSKPPITSSKNDSSSSRAKSKRASLVATVKLKCSYCRGEHSIYYCKDFLSLAIPQRISEIRKNKICVNCLRSTAHASSNCTAGACKICKLKHNTLLHLTDDKLKSRDDDDRSHKETTKETTPANAPTALFTHGLEQRNNKRVMLSTAVVYAYDGEGSRRSCRVLLDSGSQANFISRRFLETLGIKASESNISISGISNITTRASQVAPVRLQSRTSSFCTTINCIVTEQVTDRLPAFTLRRSNFEIPRNVKLADPQFNVSSDIDILVGAELFWQLLCIGRIQLSSSQPMLQKTQFGWILAGPYEQVTGMKNRVQACHASVTNLQLHNQLTRFWEQEEIKNSSDLTKSEALCEQHFLNNLARTS